MRLTYETRKHHYTVEFEVSFNHWAIPLSVGFGRPSPLNIPTMLFSIGPFTLIVERRIVVKEGRG